MRHAPQNERKCCLRMSRLIRGWSNTSLNGIAVIPVGHRCAQALLLRRSDRSRARRGSSRSLCAKALNWTHFRDLATRTEVLSSRTLTKLLSKAPEAALVNHVVKWHLLWEQGRRLNTQVKPLDVDLPVGAIACNDQKAEPVDVALEISIGLFAGFRNSI